MSIKNKTFFTLSALCKTQLLKAHKKTRAIVHIKNYLTKKAENLTTHHTALIFAKHTKLKET
jgi:hypothetical protein